MGHDERIDWSHDPDLENPLLIPDELVPIHGSPVWDKLNEKERGNVRRHMVRGSSASSSTASRAR